MKSEGTEHNKVMENVFSFIIALCNNNDMAEGGNEIILFVHFLVCGSVLLLMSVCVFVQTHKSLTCLCLDILSGQC